jgi:hypothetical protein
MRESRIVLVNAAASCPSAAAADPRQPRDEKSGARGAPIDRSASVNAILSLHGPAILNATEWTSDRTLTVNGQTGVTLNIAAGGIAVVELTAAKK